MISQEDLTQEYFSVLNQQMNYLEPLINPDKLGRLVVLDSLRIINILTKINDKVNAVKNGDMTPAYRELKEEMDSLESMEKEFKHYYEEQSCEGGEVIHVNFGNK